MSETYKTTEAVRTRCAAYYANNKEAVLKLDHIIPQSKGGGHTIDNLQWLCPRINRAKGTSSNEEIKAWWSSAR